MNCIALPVPDRIRKRETFLHGSVQLYVQLPTCVIIVNFDFVLR